MRTILDGESERSAHPAARPWTAAVCRASPVRRRSPACRAWTKLTSATWPSSESRSTPAPRIARGRASVRPPSARVPGCCDRTTRPRTASRSPPPRWPTPGTSPAIRSTSRRRSARSTLASTRSCTRCAASWPWVATTPLRCPSCAPSAAVSEASRCCTSMPIWIPGTPTSVHPTRMARRSAGPPRRASCWRIAESTSASAGRSSPEPT